MESEQRRPARGTVEGREAHVRVMDSRPPPAPARACAMLSLCCSAVEVAAEATCRWTEGLVLSDIVADLAESRMGGDQGGSF